MGSGSRSHDGYDGSSLIKRHRACAPVRDTAEKGQPVIPVMEGCSWPAGSQSSRWFPNVGTIRRTSWGCGDRGDYPVREVTALAARRAGACSPPRRGRSSSTAAAGGGTAAHFSSDFENRPSSVLLLRTGFHSTPSRPLRGPWLRFPSAGLPVVYPGPIARPRGRIPALRSASYLNPCAWSGDLGATRTDPRKPTEETMTDEPAAAKLPATLSGETPDPSPAAEVAPIAPARARTRPTPSDGRIRVVDLTDLQAVAAVLGRGWRRLR